MARTRPDQPKADDGIRRIKLPYLPPKVDVDKLDERDGKLWLLNKAATETITEHITSIYSNSDGPLRDGPPSDTKFRKGAFPRVYGETISSSIIKYGDKFCVQYQEKGADKEGKRINVLGEGGFGKVKVAQIIQANQTEKDQIGTWVAVKTLAQENADQPSVTAETERGREAGLSYGSFKKTYSKTGNKDYVIIMKLVPGLDLIDWGNKRAVHASDAQLLQVAINICKCIKEAHQKGILVNDIKPDNLMIGDDLSVTLIDYGHARKLAAGQSTCKSKDPLGTPAIVAPESREPTNDEYEFSYKSDVYSTGITIAMLLRLCTPIPDNTTPAKLVDRAMKGELINNLSLSGAVLDICRGLTDTRPEMRSLDDAIEKLRARQLKLRRQPIKIVLYDIAEDTTSGPNSGSKIDASKYEGVTHLVLVDSSGGEPKTLKDLEKIKKDIREKFDSSKNPLIQIQDTVYAKEGLSADDKTKIHAEVSEKLNPSRSGIRLTSKDRVDSPPAARSDRRIVSAAAAGSDASAEAKHSSRHDGAGANAGANASASRAGANASASHVGVHVPGRKGSRSSNR